MVGAAGAVGSAGVSAGVVVSAAGVASAGCVAFFFLQAPTDKVNARANPRVIIRACFISIFS